MAEPQPSEGLDPDAAQRVAWSFLVVRLVRGTLILLFLAIAIVAVEIKGWPRGVSVALGLTMLLQLGLMVSAIRTYARSTSP